MTKNEKYKTLAWLDQTSVNAENHERTKSVDCLEIKSDPTQQMFNVQIFGSKNPAKVWAAHSALSCVQIIYYSVK